MKKNIIKKISLLLSAVLLLMLLTATASFAWEDPYYVDEEYTVWEMSDDGERLKGNGKEYTFYDAPIMPKDVSHKVFHFVNYVTYGDRIFSIHSDSKDSDIMWAEDLLYVTEEAKEKLDAFYSGEGVIYRLYGHYGEEAPMREAYLRELQLAGIGAAAEFETFNVTALARMRQYEIVACDPEGRVGYGCGALFLDGDNMYYVDYETLDNSYFDSYGELSFRKGSITMLKLSAGLSSKMKALANSVKYVTMDIEMEYDHGYDIVVPFPTFGWYGIGCPACGVAVGIIAANSKKLGKSRRWYVLSGVSAVTLILSVVVWLMLS